MKPEEIVERFKLVEDTTDPRWTGTPKRVWRGNRHRHGVVFADPCCDWGSYDRALAADVYNAEESDRPGWQYIDGWIDGPYRVVWVSFEYRATFTYCEGDLTLVTCDDEATFRKELADAERYYGEMIR
jgi:hypothetical protein